MLVLTRERDQRIRLFIPPGTEGRVVDVVLVGMTGRACRLGFEADAEVRIVRGELLGKENGVGGDRTE